ncbi:MAG: nitrite reductase, partial [Gammaproteobacteria bacterium]|nr:nitrite reductase [Gammaproteobacteria bacterium]
MPWRFKGFLGILGLLAVQSTSAAPDVKQLYTQHCAECHGAERLGGMGPALLPGNLGRLKMEEARQVIAEGRPATQMPGFAQQLSAEEITLLADLAFTAPEEMPDWTLEDMRASQLVPHPAGSLPDKPAFEADMMNLFIVVELGDNHATLLDGDRFEPIHRFATRFALHGGPKYSADGRYVYFASRDGWISKFDIYNLKTVAEIRAGINTRNLAVSPDGRYVLVGNYLPHSLVILDGRNLDPLQVIPVRDEEGNSSRVSAVYTAPPRNSFIAALKDLTEVWEIQYPQATDSGTPEFSLRRIRLDDYLDDFFFDPEYRHLMGAARNAKNGQVVDLDAGRKVDDLDLDG